MSAGTKYVFEIQIGFYCPVSADLSNCAAPSWHGDNFCDDENNNEACYYDGGDCCTEGTICNFCAECLCHATGMPACPSKYNVVQRCTMGRSFMILLNSMSTWYNNLLTYGVNETFLEVFEALYFCCLMTCHMKA